MGLSVIYFHDMPVYRLSEQQFRREREKYIASFVEPHAPHFTADILKSMQTRLEQDYFRKFGPWCFNEIIGYVRLHFLGNQVRGEFFQVDRARIVKTRCKTLTYRSHKLASERSVPRSASNEEIFNVVLGYVEACRREKPRRYFDDNWLRRIGPYVDWNAVMKQGWSNVARSP